MLGSKFKGQAKRVAKKLDRFMKAPKTEMCQHLEDVDVIDENIIAAYDQYVDACDICAASGRPVDRRKFRLHT